MNTKTGELLLSDSREENNNSITSKGKNSFTPIDIKKMVIEPLSFESYQNKNLHFKHGQLFYPLYAADIMARLESEIRYADPELTKIQVYGKWHKIPRKQISHGDPGVTYAYSGSQVEALEWTPLLNELREVVKQVCGHSYNFVLINRYENGMDRVGFHSDDKESIDQNIPIVSLSFGAKRNFIFRHKFNKTLKKEIELESGSILIMESPTNKYWHHSLPPCKKCTSPRVNLTFREIKKSC